LRKRPDPPITPPADSDKVYATPADYHGRSFYTYRWQPVDNLKTHIFRALDDSVFKADWARRERETATLSAEDEDLFPPEMRGANPMKLARREAAADELNHLDTFSHNEEGKTQAQVYYRGLSNDALRVLAGLPGNERVFSQVTIKPLDPDDPKNDDCRGANDPEDYKPDEDLRIYVDTLPGRTSSRYFYRAAYVDGAQNRSYLSLSSPPIYMPKVTPPRTPVITKVQGGNRQITLSWNCSREPDLVEYRIYRTDNNENARDIRLMTQVHSEVIPSGDPMERPVVMQQIDEVPNLRSWYYRIVAIDVAGNVSPPSKLVTAQAYDLSPPAPPTWRRAEHVRIDQFGNEKPADAVLDVYTPAAVSIKLK
jgi:hypothetical protein